MWYMLSGHMCIKVLTNISLSIFLLTTISNAYCKIIQKWKFWKAKLQLPISSIRPDKAEQPGPPVSHNMRGSSFGLFSDSMK